VTVLEDLIDFYETIHGKLIAPWSRVHVEKLTDFQLVRKFFTFYGTRRFFALLEETNNIH
jgi:hypothetical protein